MLIMRASKTAAWHVEITLADNEFQNRQLAKIARENWSAKLMIASNFARIISKLRFDPRFSRDIQDSLGGTTTHTHMFCSFARKRNNSLARTWYLSFGEKIFGVPRVSRWINPLSRSVSTYCHHAAFTLLRAAVLRSWFVVSFCGSWSGLFSNYL